MVQCANASSLLKVFACVCSNDPNPFLPTLVTAFAHAMNSHRNSCDWLVCKIYTMKPKLFGIQI